MQRFSADPAFSYSFVIPTEPLHSPLFVLISDANTHILLR